MDSKHAGDLKAGARVAVFMGEAVSALTGAPPLVTTATVMEQSDLPPTGPDDQIWLAVEFTSNSASLPQTYAVREILGYLLPLVHVTESADGSTMIGTLPSDYVGP